MNKAIAKKILLSSSLFSTTRYSIIEETTLEINKISQSKAKKDFIPLDDIDQEIRIQSRPNDILIILSLTLFMFSFLFLNLIQERYLLGGVVTALLVISSIITSIFAFKFQTVSYSFFLSKTETPIFSITESQKKSSRNTKPITDTELFVTNLQREVIENHKKQSQASSYISQDDKFTLLKEKIDEIFNYGLMNEVMYKSIISQAQYKILGEENHQSASSDNVIDFQSRRLLKETA